MMRIGLWFVVSFLFSLSATHAAIIASDNAANAAYNDGWQPGDNGGTGWGGGWTFRNQSNTVLTTTNSQRGWFLASSLNNNSPAGSDPNNDGDINTPPNAGGRAWGLYSNGTTADHAIAVRPFASTLPVGHTIHWDIDNGNVATNQVVGLRLLSNQNDTNSRVFEFRFVGGNSNYTVFDSTGSRATTIPFSREGIRLAYTLTGPSTYSLSILRLSTGDTETITGTNVNANSIAALAFKNQFAGSGQASDAFLNSISIMSPNQAPTVDDAEYFNVGPGTLTHMFTATDPDNDPLTWSNFTFLDYTQAYGGVGTGPAIAATFDANTQEFEWNNLGSPRGIYRWSVTASDGEFSDDGIITIHKTMVPEPSAFLLCVLAGACVIPGRRKGGRTAL